MEKSLTKIGEIKSVNGNTISVQLDDNIKSNMPIINGVVYKIGQVGTFLKIPLGYSILYGIITQIGASAIPNTILLSNQIPYSDMQNKQWVTLSLIGEQIGKHFERGISISPTTGDQVHLVTFEDLSILYESSSTESSIQVGNISSSSSLKALIDINKLVTRHFAILGSTGSGKSNAVGVLVNSIKDSSFKNERILIVDVHGEYVDAIIGAKVFQVHPSGIRKKLVIPYWALPFEELISIFGVGLADDKLDYIREKITQMKVLSNKTNSLKIEEELITADSPIPFSIKQLWFDLDDFERITYTTNALTTPTLLVETGDPDKLISNKYQPAAAGSAGPFLNRFAKGINRFLESVRTKIKDSRYKFLFEPDDFTPDLTGKVTKDINELLFDWIGNSKVSILDLSDIPSEIMVSITGTLLKIIYDTLYWGQQSKSGGKKQPILIILEEAHNYLNVDSKTISSKTVQKISKEGRKYGVGLGLVSQRPSELDPTILSQCGTIVSLRMNNFSDRNYAKGAIQDELQGLLDILPSLRTGEAIISGEAVKIPSRVQFFKLDNAIKGSDPNVTECWNSSDEHVIEDYTSIIKGWRSQSFDIEEEEKDDK
jgi:DNA helicase HerA-like ATPase